MSVEPAPRIRARGSRLAPLAMAVGVTVATAVPAGGNEPPASPEAALRLLKQAAADALGSLFGVSAADQLAARRAQQALEEQQQELIKQQARQLEQLLQPLVRAELELVRTLSGDLPAEARREVLAAGRSAAATLAAEAAARQVHGGLSAPQSDPRTGLHQAIARAIAPHVSADQLSAYDREEDRRTQRRAEAARLRIVAKLDETLDLSGPQRAAILADLREGWDPAWLRELDDRGGLVVNNHRPAPDYATDRIVPHLDHTQRAAWLSWCRAAGSRVLGPQARWHFDGPGLPPDPWWENP